MNKNRLTNVVVGPILVLVAIFAFQTLKPAAGFLESARPAVGMGDLRRYEAQLGLPNTGALAVSQPEIGMGDLRAFEAQQEDQRIGMGDLRRFEAQQAIRRIGMGDLRRLEAQQALHAP